MDADGIVRVDDISAALEQIKTNRFSAVFVSGSAAAGSLEEVLEEIQRINCGIPVVIQGGGITMPDAVRLARLGAYQCFGGEFDLDRLMAVLDDALDAGPGLAAAAGSGQAAVEPWRQFLVGDSAAMRKVAQVIRLVGNRRCTVLVTGETGTGKEMAARALHMASPRAHLPMVTVNCGALPEHLMEAELFGYVKGAFTGAVGNRLGRCEQAHKSTLFLDEIGDMPLDLQVKLLRVLQEREFQRLGSSETVRVDLRVIAASNVNLLEQVRLGKFRQDLYYRLNVVPMQMPSLRERRSDIPLLVNHFIEKLCRLEDLPLKSIGPEALERLACCEWPGNVRELENAVEMAIAMSGDRSTLHTYDFPVTTAAKGKVISIAKPSSAMPEGRLQFDAAVSEFERTLLTQALQRAGGNKTLAADMLGLKRTTLLAKMRNLDVHQLSLNTA